MNPSQQACGGNCLANEGSRQNSSSSTRHPPWRIVGVRSAILPEPMPGPAAPARRPGPAPEVYNAGLTGNAVAATIAHEVKQPLSGMITNADAGLRWLDRSTPDLDEAKAAFKQIVADGHRAAAVIESIRAIFKKDARNRASLDVNELIGEDPALTRGDLQRHRILVQAEPNAQLPQVRGDRIQLQQVLLNLLTTE